MAENTVECSVIVEEHHPTSTLTSDWDESDEVDRIERLGYHVAAVQSAESDSAFALYFAEGVVTSVRKDQ